MSTRRRRRQFNRHILFATLCVLLLTTGTANSAWDMYPSSACKARVESSIYIDQYYGGALKCTIADACYLYCPIGRPQSRTPANLVRVDVDAYHASPSHNNYTRVCARYYTGYSFACVDTEFCTGGYCTITFDEFDLNRLRILSGHFWWIYVNFGLPNHINERLISYEAFWN